MAFLDETRCLGLDRNAAAEYEVHLVPGVRAPKVEIAVPREIRLVGIKLLKYEMLEGTTVGIRAIGQSSFTDYGVNHARIKEVELGFGNRFALARLGFGGEWLEKGPDQGILQDRIIL